MKDTSGERQRQLEPCRQVHLDFHTSEHMPAVGANWDKRLWQDALKLGRVNLINIFAKCHHSWCYYPTRAGRTHPTLTFDLLGAQIEACHEMGVKIAPYIAVGWSANDALAHPEWLCRNRDGSVSAINVNPAAAPADPRPVVSWQNLCPNSEGYHQLVLAHAREICEAYEIDGLWLDIYFATRACFCDTCSKGMRDEGVDPADANAAQAYYLRAVKARQADVKRLLLARHPRASIYFNGTTSSNWPETFTARLFEHNTKNDLEDLPTTWGGYDKFPLRSRLFHAVGAPVTAMTGKFHTMWGEFGGFKHRDALRYEAACMIANGARCNIGDQMHPAGCLDPATYANIGHAYRYVEQIEEYGVPGLPVSNLALWYSGNSQADEGVAAMLLEIQAEFQVVRSGHPIAPHIDVLVIPGGPCLSDRDVAAIAAFQARGGKLLVLGAGAMDANLTRPLLDIGADYTGPANYTEDYTMVSPAVGDDLPASPFLNYQAALRFAPRRGAETLAGIHEPFFNRTYAAYCSHQNTPYRLEAAAQPAVFRCGNVVCLAHDLGGLYFNHGARVHRQLFANALALLHTRPMLAAPMPSSGRATLLHQPHANRYVVHLTYASPMQRGRCKIIEDLPALTDVAVSIRVPERIREAFLAPSGQPLPIRRSAGAVSVVVPKFSCHVAAVFALAPERVRPGRRTHSAAEPLPSPG
jgi:hypothetical protein